MKHNLLKSLIISVSLLMGVSNAWAGRIYFKPQDGWKEANARFAAYFYNSSTSAWTSFLEIQDGSGIYLCEIPEGGYTNVILCRMNGANSTNNWDNKWNKSIDLVLQNNSLYVQPAINGNWDSWSCNAMPITWYASGTFNNWEQGNQYTLPCNITLNRETTYEFKICGIAGSDKIWLGNDGEMTRQYNQDWTMDAIENCELTTDIEGTYSFNFDYNNTKLSVTYPTKYTVTLEGSSYGTFIVKCDNYQQTSSTSSTPLDVPAGATITIKDIEPHNKVYDQTMVYSAAGANYTYFSDSTEIDGNRTYTYTVNSDVTIAEDFRTKNDHVFYLKVTEEPFAYWCAKDNDNLPRIMWTHGLNQERLYNEENLRPFTKIKEENAYNIYRVTIPAGFNTFSIYACNQFTSSKSFRILPDGPTKNCYELTNEEVTIIDNIPSTNGHWIASKVSLEPCNIGTYGIIYNNVEYLNDATNETVIEMPYGSSIQIIDATPTSPHYMANPRYKTSIMRKWYLTEFEKDQTIEVDDDYNFAPNLVTKESHRVYLRIPNNLRSDWNKNSNGEHFNGIYLRDYLSNWRTKHPSNDNPDIQYGMVVKSNSHETFEADEDELWYIDIPAGYHTFVFERKNSVEQGTGFTAQGETFYYGIPTDGVNICYTITGKSDPGGDERLFKGTWGPLPTCTIIAGYPDIGSYGIKYNGEVHYATSNPKRNAEFEVPYGAEVEVVESNPGDEAYTNTIGMLNPEENRCVHAFDFTGDPANNIVTITRKTKFDDLYATKDNKHVVFLAIPKNDDRINRWLSCNEGSHTQGHDIILWQSINTYHYPEEHTYKLHEKEEIIETDNFLYYKFTLEKNVYRFNFQYKSKSNTTDTGFDGMAAHAGSTTEHCPPISTKNCFILDGGIDKDDKGNDNHAGGYTGYWDYGPPCKVEMGYTNIGRYGIKDYNNTIHYAIPGVTNTIFYVPYGTQVEVLEGEPGNDNYNGMVGLFNGDNVVKKFHDGQNQDNFVTITGYTMFDDLFISKAPHEVYLGVPNEGFDNWRLNDGERMTVRHLWPRDYIPHKYVNYEEMFVIDDITYYKFTLPQGLCSFQFSHRQQSNDSQISASRHFLYQIPVTEYNCFILENRRDGNGDYDGYWAKLPKPNVGDYRVLYAEKELIKTHEEGETEDWETAFHTVYEHPSDIIPKGEASKTISLHINTSQKRGDKTVHPLVILQQFQQIENNTYKWVNLQAHTVLPLKATGNMGMLPGRKKAFGDLPFYDNGIEAIKNDTTYSSRLGRLYKGSGVWNFTVTQGVSQSGTGTTVTLNVGNTTRYTGKYYIRTEALTNGWNNYKENLMTYSDYADYNSGFSHYFCKWLLAGNNVKFTIANDYAQSISDPLFGDLTDLRGNPIAAQMVECDEALNEDANVRFAWYEMNNFVHRAYLGGSTHVHDRFLVVKGDDDKIFSHYVGKGLPAQGEELLEGKDNGSDPRYGLKDNEEIFRDDANWIYHADVQILPGCSATITAKHYGKEQYFIENAPLVHGYDPNQAKNKYPIRLLYDFKINRLITGYIPNGDNNTDIEAFTTNLMLIRKHHEQATQLLFNSNAKTTQGAYGVMTFERDFLRNNDKTNKERAAYFISFPFDVKISDVFGFGQFYKHWFIQYYDGAARAQNGLWADTDTYWKHITDPNTVLEAHKGYALLFSLSNIEKSGVLDASKEISLYFPSTNNNIGNITDVNPEQNVKVPAHVCTIERENRKVKDSNWNLIGVPAYADVSDFTNKTFKDPYNNEVYFYWKRDPSTDQYTVEYAKDSPLLTFQTMHAYMLQYAGVINWKANEMDQHDYSNKLIARRNTEQEASHTLRITLNQADKKLDQTYVRLQEEDATADFDMNKDQYKIRKAKANIYSLIQNAVGQIEAGANVLPLQTTIVPLGVIIKTAGEYTFSMPDGTDGIVVELIDYETNTRTNMLFDNYTVTLPAGTNNSRFALHVKPSKVTTSVEDVTTNTMGVKKYLIDGVLYMQKDGVLYDAQGKLVR